MEVQSYKNDNERIIREKEEQNHINTHLLQSLKQLQKQVRVGASSRHEERGRSHARGENYKGSRHSRSISRTHKPHHSPIYSTRKEHLSEESHNIPEVSIVSIKGE
jgi:hypothetical protein